MPLRYPEGGTSGKWKVESERLNAESGRLEGNDKLGFSGEIIIASPFKLLHDYKPNDAKQP